VELAKEDIESILDTLIYDGKIEKITKEEEEKVFYTVMDPFLKTTGLVQVPCGICPVAKDCSERGSVNPTACIYISNWLSTEF